MSENNTVRLPEVIVFAGPNGSGKSTITQMAKIGGKYINADDIKRTTLCTDLEAAIKAEELRENMIENKKDFTFETVLSTDRNLLLLQKAKEQGYFVRGIYVLTANVVNVARVQAREALGGHGVPEDKIRSRYRIFKKRKDKYYHWSNQYWSNADIEKLSGIVEYVN